MKLLKFVPVLVVVLAVLGCAPALPQKDVDAANKAFADAKTAQADVLAPESFKAASDANDALQANLTAKEYGKTAALAKNVVDASAKASADAAAGLDKAKADVAQLTTDVAAAAELVKKELDKAVKAGKKAKIDVKKIQEAVAAADKTAEEGKAAAAANVVDAKVKLTAAKDAFAAAQKDLEAAGFKL